MLNSFHEGVTDSIYAVTTSPTPKAISGVVLNVRLMYVRRSSIHKSIFHLFLMKCKIVLGGSLQK